MEVYEDVIVTKRVVLSILARVIDPLGCIATVVITGKILFQQLWRLGVEWDEEIQPQLSKQFKDWIENLEHLKALSIQ